MDLRQLRYFVAIVESRTLTEASRRLHIVQPALSQRLAALEEDLGAQLLVRGRSGLAVTEAGQELYEHARVILKQTERARSAVQEKAGTASGRVAIGVLRSLAPLIGAALFRALREELPGVQPAIAVGYSEELLQALRATRLDLSLGVQQRTGSSVLEGSHLFSEGIHLISAPGLLPPGHAGVPVEALREVPLVVPSTKGPVHAQLEALARRQGFELQVVGSVEDQASVLALCAEGTVASYAPESSARHMAARAGLLVQPLLEPSLARKVFLYTHAEVPKTGAVVAVENVLARVVTQFAGQYVGP